MGVTSVAIQFTIVDLLSRGIDKIKSRMKSLSRSSKEVQKSFDKMTKSLKYAAFTGIATRELYKGMKPAVSAAGDLQKEMIAVKAEMMGAGKSSKTLVSQLKEMKTTAFSVQAWTPFDMGNIVALEKELVKAGATIKEIVGEKGAAAAASALAVYEELNPVEAGKALIGIGTPFKIAADQYMNLADMISRASSASVTGAAEIAESAKYAAGPMAQLGRSQKEMLALAAGLAQVGVDASMAGTTIKNFFLRAAKIKEFQDAKGNLKSMADIIRVLRDSLRGKGEAKQSEILQELFSERGMQLAIALLNEGKGSYEEMMKAMDESASLQDKLNESMKGFNNQVMSLKGTTKSVFADLFQPALRPLTALIRKTNEFVTLVGKASQKNESLSKLVSGGSLTTLLAGGAATTVLAGAGVLYGRKVLKGVGGIKGLLRGAGGAAAGIATGKAVEAATGVTPVFVTNWPGGFGGADLVNPLKGMKSLAKVGGVRNLLKGAAPLLGKAGLAGAVGYGSYKLGTALGLDKVGTWLGEKIWDIFNPEEARMMRENEERLKNRSDIYINIEKDGRTTVNTDNNTEANVKTRGVFDNVS